MFTINSVDLPEMLAARGMTKYRYLIKHQGVWKILATWASKPDWDDEVTDVVWLQDKETMIASWWLMKNGRRNVKRQQIAKDEELTILLLQAERS